MRLHGLSARGEGCIEAARDERGAQVEKDWPAGSFGSRCVGLESSDAVIRGHFGGTAEKYFQSDAHALPFYDGAGIT